MRIDLNSKSPETRQAERPNSSSSRADSRGRAAIREDQASLSLNQARMRTLESQVAQMPEVRSERVKALAQRIKDGTYDVSAQQTADALISEMMSRTTVR